MESHITSLRRQVCFLVIFRTSFHQRQSRNRSGCFSHKSASVTAQIETGGGLVKSYGLFTCDLQRR